MDSEGTGSITWCQSSLSFLTHTHRAHRGKRLCKPSISRSALLLCCPGKVDLFSVFSFATLNANHSLPRFCQDTPRHWRTHTRKDLTWCVLSLDSTLVPGVHFLLHGYLLSYWTVKHIPVGHGLVSHTLRHGYATCFAAWATFKKWQDARGQLRDRH